MDGIDNCHYFSFNEHKDFFRKPKLSIEYNSSEPNDFTPILELVSPDGTGTGIKRRYLKVLIRNIGNATAVKCKAELKVLQINNKIQNRHPSDTKILCWETPID